MKRSWILGLMSLFALQTTMSFSPAHAATNSAVPSVEMQKLALGKTFEQRLRGVQKFGVIVVYPTAMPERYKLKKVEIGGDDAKHPDYTLVFAGKGHHTLTVESAYTGIGDGPEGDKILNSQSATFGKGTINVFKPHSEGNGTADVYYLSDWGKPTRKVSKDAERNYHVYGTGITDKEAVALVNSLTPIK